MVDGTFCFCVGKAENRVDRLLFGVAYKAAGVDNDRTGIGRVGVEGEFKTAVMQLRHHVFRVYDILGTSECDDIDFPFFHVENLGQK